jgi:hypothetical protein
MLAACQAVKELLTCSPVSSELSARFSSKVVQRIELTASCAFAAAWTMRRLFRCSLQTQPWTQAVGVASVCLFACGRLAQRSAFPFPLPTLPRCRAHTGAADTDNLMPRIGVFKGIGWLRSCKAWVAYQICFSSVSPWHPRYGVAPYSPRAMVPSPLQARSRNLR